MVRPVDLASTSCAFSTQDGYIIEFVEWFTALFVMWGKWPWKINVRKEKTCLMSVMCSVQTIRIPSTLSCLRHLSFSMPEPALCSSIFASRYSSIVTSSVASPIFIHLSFQVFFHAPFQLLRPLPVPQFLHSRLGL